MDNLKHVLSPSFSRLANISQTNSLIFQKLLDLIYLESLHGWDCLNDCFLVMFFKLFMNNMQSCYLGYQANIN